MSAKNIKNNDMFSDCESVEVFHCITVHPHNVSNGQLESHTEGILEILKNIGADITDEDDDIPNFPSIWKGDSGADEAEFNNRGFHSLVQNNQLNNTLNQVLGNFGVVNPAQHTDPYVNCFNTFSKQMYFADPFHRIQSCENAHDDEKNENAVLISENADKLREFLTGADTCEIKPGLWCNGELWFQINNAIKPNISDHGVSGNNENRLDQKKEDLVPVTLELSVAAKYSIKKNKLRLSEGGPVDWKTFLNLINMLGAIYRQDSMLVVFHKKDGKREGRLFENGDWKSNKGAEEEETHLGEINTVHNPGEFRRYDFFTTPGEDPVVDLKSMLDCLIFQKVKLRQLDDYTKHCLQNDFQLAEIEPNFSGRGLTIFGDAHAHNQGAITIELSGSFPYFFGMNFPYTCNPPGASPTLPLHKDGLKFQAVLNDLGVLAGSQALTSSRAHMAPCVNECLIINNQIQAAETASEVIDGDTWRTHVANEFGITGLMDRDVRQ